MKFAKKIAPIVFIFIISLSFVSELWAQRNVGYRELSKKQQQPMFFSTIVLPGNTDSTVTFASVFSFSYNYLPFKKSKQYSSGKEFYSTTELSMEVLNGKDSDGSSLEDMDPVTRTFWSDTAFAETFEQTQSNKKFLEGNLSVTLKPGTYNYILQLKRGDQAESQLSESQQEVVSLYSEMKRGSILMGDEVHSDEDPSEFVLSTLGDNVEYGKDFFALAYIPEYDSEASYSLHINRLQVANGDTSSTSERYSQDLLKQDFQTGVKPELAETGTNKKNIIRLKSSEEGFSYALVKIPNSTLPNANYRMTIKNNENEQIAASSHYRSNWLNMPTSLLSLDVAIEMLHYITDEETQNNLSRGSNAERTQKFREFWKKRDPTPNTHFNELMAEYYRRVDYAYENFTTDNTIGYESDRGEIYIKHGAPENIERRYPTDGATMEIWEYSNRRFVFRATTGFGDFELAS